MQATQTRLVNTTSTSTKANVAQAKPAPKPVATPKTGTRFLDRLMSALGGVAV